jgi:hypothetical protein
MATSTTKNAYVAILTSENIAIRKSSLHAQTLELTNVAMLTEFFLDNANISTGVKTFLLDDEAVSETGRLFITNTWNYTKEICNVDFFWHVIMGDFFDVPKPVMPVMFIFAHGNGGGGDDNYISFGDHGKNIVLTKPQSGPSGPSWDHTCLHNVIKGSKLVFLSCCHGGAIVREYLSMYGDAQANEIPDILYWDGEHVLHIANAIFCGWLIMVMDTANSPQFEENPKEDNLYKGVKQSIKRIIGMVLDCKGDEDKFTEILHKWGCIWDVGGRNDVYRIFGHTKNIVINEKLFTRLFEDFQSLTLLERIQEHQTTRMQIWNPRLHVSESSIYSPQGLNIYLVK